MEQKTMYNLTDRESAIYKLICEENLPKKEIAKRLCISISTLNTHLANIYMKTGITDKASLIHDYWKGRQIFLTDSISDCIYRMDDAGSGEEFFEQLSKIRNLIGEK